MEAITTEDLILWAKDAKVNYAHFSGRSGSGSLSLYGKSGNYEVIHNGERIYFGNEEWKAVSMYNEICPFAK